MGRHENRFILIFMNFDGIIIKNEKMRENQKAILTKLLISQLVIALELQSWSQSNAKTQYFYLMGRYENKFVRIFMNYDEIIIN